MHGQEPLIPGKYRHYKGGMYEVVGTARHSETEEQLVVYRCLYDNNSLWVRPLSMFVETVLVDGREVPRFQRCDEGTARAWIDRLSLIRHPEGGWYRETYRAAGSVPAAGLPHRYGGERSFSTAIYFLLSGDDFSALHRLRSDELWHFHAGSPLTVHVIDPKGRYETLRLGGDPEKGESFQGVVPAGSWFGATVEDPDSFALVGCTVAPGFDFADFEMGDQDELVRRFPQHAPLIRRLTRVAEE